MWYSKHRGKRSPWPWEKFLFLSGIVSLFLSLYACAPKAPPSPGVSSPVAASGLIAPAPEPPRKERTLEPVFEEISPLETHRISLSVKEEDAFEIFYFLAREVGLNLIIENEAAKYLSPEKRLVTAEFHDYTVKDILDTLCKSLDLSYEIQEGVIHIKVFEERLFDLSFLKTLRGSRFSLGGDVLGGGQGAGGAGAGGGGGATIISPLKGQYEVTGETPEEATDVYQQLEDALKSLLSKEGTYSLNRLTGLLWVRDHPSGLRKVGDLIKRLQKRYSQQVLIEAKIVEVILSKGHNLGIDWLQIRESRLTNASNLRLDISPQMTALTFSYQHKPSFEGMIQVLENYGQVKVLSNPRIRILHGQPALISVGRSVGYVREITRELISGNNVSQSQTTVETSAVFDCFLLGVTPHITDSGEILLHIVPIKSDLVDLRREEFQNTAVTLPQVNLREMSTVIKVSSHDLVVIGGLILDKRNLGKRGVWGLGRLPGLGSLFKHSVREDQKVELVILLRVSLV